MPSRREHWFRLLNQSGETGSPERAFGVVAGIAANLHFPYCSFTLHMPGAPSSIGHPLSLSTFPPRQERRLNLGLDVDPVVASAIHGTVPFVWSEKMSGAANERTLHGWALAVHGRHHEIGLVSLARSDRAISGLELDDVEATLVWLAHAASSVIAEIVAERHASTPENELTSREREVLRWTAAGKTSYETGVILGITTRTVNFHIAAILDKLNVTNKAQAAVKATVLELLH